MKVAYVKRSLPNRRARSCAQKVKIVDLDDLEVVFLPKRRLRTEKSTTLSKTITKSAKSSSDDNQLQQRSEINAAEPPATEDDLEKTTEQAKKTPKNMNRCAEDDSEKTTEKAKKIPKDMNRCREAEFRPFLQFGFVDQLSSKLSPGYREPSSAIDDIGRSRILNRRLPGCFHELGADDQHVHVIRLLHAFLI